MSCVECSLSTPRNAKRNRPHSWHCTEFCRSTPHSSKSNVSEEESPCAPQQQPQTSCDNDTKLQLGLFEVDYTIGIGNYSVVKHAVHRILRNEVAIKTVDKTKLDSDSLSRVQREIEILKRLRHPYVIHLYQIIETESHLYIVTEYASKGELYEYIKRRKRLDEDEARKLFWQLFSAVEYCHQNGVSHRDIKAENVLIDESGRLKLADFGFSNFHAKDYYSRTFCGSPPYAAPEIFNGTAYLGSQADIWSLGVTLYVMTTGTMPFSGAALSDLKAKVLQGQFRIPYYMSSELENLLRRMICVNPKKRITISQIKEHPWLKKSTHCTQIRQEITAFNVVSNADATVACINIMKGLGVPVEKINTSLQSMEYDHAMCLFLLLMERYRRRNFESVLAMIKDKEEVPKLWTSKTDVSKPSIERVNGRPSLKQLRGHPQFVTTDTVSSLGTTSSISRQSTNTVGSVDEGVDFTVIADANDLPTPLTAPLKKISEIKQTSVNGSEGAIMAAKILKATIDDFRSSENNVADSFPTGNIGDRTDEIAAMYQQPGNNETVSQRMQMLSLSSKEKPTVRTIAKRVMANDAKIGKQKPSNRNGYFRTFPYNVLQRSGPHRMLSVPTETIALSGN